MNYDLEGCRVRFSHFRPSAGDVDAVVRRYKRFPACPLRRVVIREYVESCNRGHYVRGQTEWMPSVWGGTTFCEIRDLETDKAIAVGSTDCKYPDHFCYKAGRDAAFHNALRNAVWQLKNGKELDGEEL